MINKIKLIDVKTDNISEYYKTNLLLAFPNCIGKCKNCQNTSLYDADVENYVIEDIINLYNNLNTHEAVVCAGLEPFDSGLNLLQLFKRFLMNKKPVDFVIYTGYNENEVSNIIRRFKDALNTYGKSEDSLIIKFGRYLPQYKNKSEEIDDILKVKLATTNQYAIKY